MAEIIFKQIIPMYLYLFSKPLSEGCKDLRIQNYSTNIHSTDGSQVYGVTQKPVGHNFASTEVLPRF